MKIFITGTGTQIGKTYISCALIEQRRRSGHEMCALKPIQSGGGDDDPASDAAQLIAACGQALTPTTLAATAPWRFEAPLAPPLAAANEGQKIDFDAVVSFCRTHMDKARGDLLIEGAGGIMSPLSDERLNIDLARALGLPVLLIGGTYLGAISHLLSAHAVIKNSGLTCPAIVLNETTEHSIGVEQTLHLLKPFCNDVPLIGCALNARAADAVFARLAKLCDDSPVL
jgi:dethiobiotin synthetase